MDDEQVADSIHEIISALYSDTTKGTFRKMPAASARTEQLFPFGVIIVTGFAASLAQIFIVRELLVLFYGNELSTGLIFAGWLLWTALGSGLAGKYGHRLPLTPNAVATALTAVAVLLPATLLWIRAARVLWNIPLGESLSLAKMLGISLSTTGLFCPLSGFLFAFTWTVLVKRSDGRQSRPIFIYLGEALGAALGGLVFYFVFLPHFTVLVSAWVTSGLILCVTGVFFQPWKAFSEKPLPSLFWWVVSLSTVLSFFFLPYLDHSSRRWQWGSRLVTVRDTPYHNLALLREADLFTLFGNGLWLFSVPDPLSAERAVHPALLQHIRPRTLLLIGGGVAGLVDEILKHPHIERLDVIESDPELIRLAEKHLPSSVTGSLHAPKVDLLYEDAGSFIRRSERSYDVVLMNVGDPMNAEMNRFYTVEFYEQVKTLLNPGGIFSFAVSAAPDIIGPAQAQFLRSVYATLHTVFPRVVVFPGEDARFFATDHQGKLSTDAGELTSRIADRKLRLMYLQEYYFLDMLNPFRLDYFMTLLTKPQPSEEEDPIRVNRDFAPTCYFYSLVLWSGQINPRFKEVLTTLAGISRWWFWMGVGGVVCLMVTLFSLGRPRRAGAVAVSVAVVGGVQMVEEIVLLLGFQILAGFVYTQLALIIAFFMAGLAVGAGIQACSSGGSEHPTVARNRLFGIQALICAYLVAIIGILFLLRNQLQSGAFFFSPGVVFSLLALMGGILGGLHFSLAVRVISGSEVPSGRIGGGLYALDLVGAAVGALITSFFFLPVYGLISTLSAFSWLTFGSLLALIVSFMRRH